MVDHRSRERACRLVAITAGAVLSLMLAAALLGVEWLGLVALLPIPGCCAWGAFRSHQAAAGLLPARAAAPRPPKHVAAAHPQSRCVSMICAVPKSSSCR